MSFKIFCHFLSLIFLQGVLGINNPRIIGGSSCNIEDYPYQVSLRIHGVHHCGGTIISNRHILTAAHCLSPGDEHWITVFSGTNLSTGRKGQRHLVRAIDTHPMYQGEATSYHHDIAIITLLDKIKFDDKQDKINLPSRNVMRGEKAVVTGWGSINYPSYDPSTILQTAEMTIIPGESCSYYFSGYNVVHREQVCALQKEGVGVCLGDSGGPLTVGNEIVGVTSWVIPCGKGYPDVYTNVYSYKKWIKKITDLD